MERESSLLPDRHPQKELFLCDLGDVVVKDDMGSMESPIFSLSKTPDTDIRIYEHKDITVEVTPSVKGLATIWDKDVLIFAISQLIAAKNAGEPISQRVEFNAKDFLIFANRHTGGYSYEKLRDALARLQGTQISTNVKTGDTEEFDAFSLVDRVRVKRKTNSGRVLQWGITLSDWLFRAIENNEVLTLHKEYFRLKSSLERRIYEIARKHCGHQKDWKIGLELLQKKCGSKTPLRTFRFQVRKIIESKTIPDYILSIKDDMVLFTPQADFVQTAPKKKLIEVTENQRPHTGMLKDDTLERVGLIISRSSINLDKYALFEQWADKVQKSGYPKNIDAAFVGYAKRVAEKGSDPYRGGMTP